MITFIGVCIIGLWRRIQSTTRWFGSLRFPKMLQKRKPAKMRTKSSYSTFMRIAWFFGGFIVASILVILVAGYYLIQQDLPNPRMLTMRQIPVTTKIFDRNGILLYEFYGDQDRTPVPLAEIPDSFIHATIAIEDQHFYQHIGFSVEGITRAAYATLIHDNLQGGSTITQQLVRSALLTQDVSIKRKVKELILSVWSEQLYSKNEILEMYFNQVPYGGTAWGAEEAAQLYFDKSIRDVNLAEAALLAGLPAAPTTYSPYGSRPELAIQRQHEVLRRMVEEGYISQEKSDDATTYPITFSPPNASIKAPHMVMYIRDLLAKKYGIRMVEQGGFRVTTSIDLDLQNTVQAIVAREVENLRPLAVGNGAAVVTDPKTGEILALVGSTDYFNMEREGNVNVALTPQQPGSTIKVVTYTTALQNGYTAATLISDSPITYNIPGSPPYSPVNYDGKFHGMVSLREALGNSYNIPAVRILSQIGVPTMVETSKNMGITSWDDFSRFGLSITLGGGEVTMLDMASVYNTLAFDGMLQKSKPILLVTDYLGTIVEDNSQTQPKQVIAPQIAFIISDILSDNRARLNSFGPNSALSIPGQWVAVKTGTSNEKRDNWAIGYTKDFVVTAWVGNNNNAPMHPTLTSGITGATPIWRAITDYLLTRYPSTTTPTPPAGVISIQCRGRNEYFIAGSEKDSCRPIPTPYPSPTITIDD